MLDDTDLKIVEQLQKDGRQTYTAIAEKIGKTESTVRKRIKEMMRNGIISNFSVQLNPVAMGYSVAIVGVDTDPAKLLEVAEKLTKFEEIHSVKLSTGDHHIIAEIWAKERKLTEYIEEISTLKGVERVCPAIVLERLKP
ncbi:MAG: Lrp/AsnC family transcriptional regulator [Promethearchaeota archaeon]|jgi:Lrp/AsnC family transcriptional regulator for asnA, asnC and gidA